jgi:protein SCO1/2
MADQNNRGRLGFLAALAALGVVVAVAAFLLWPHKAPRASRPAAEREEAQIAAPPGCVLNAGDAIGGPIDLVDQNGAEVTDEHFGEAPTLIYFGYTYCPDVCPLALQMEKSALAKMGQEGGVIQPVFISVDPERDTPQTLAAYVKSEAFAPGLIGLTGSPEQVAAAAKAFRVVWQKVPAPGSAAKYLIGHSSFFYLMDDEWRLKAFFPSSFSPEAAARCMKAALQGAPAPT